MTITRITTTKTAIMNSMLFSFVGCFLSVLHQVNNYIHQYSNNQYGDNEFHIAPPFRFALINNFIVLMH